MRDSFIGALTELAVQDCRIMLLTGDLGYGVFDDYAKKFPKQYINMGVSEQNMIGVATGLALTGRKIFAYSIGNFATLRCLEHIRNDGCYHQANITIVSSGGGFTYGSLGMSHHATEDLSIMRALPGITLVVPSGGWESGEATKALANTPGVGYLRIEKQCSLETRQEGEKFQIGKARRVREGNHITLLCCGGILVEAMNAANILARQYALEARVVSMHTLHPLDETEIHAAARETGGIITLEENNIVGGLGGAVAEVCLESGVIPKRFQRIGLRDTYSSVVGSQEYLRRYYGMDAHAIVQVVLNPPIRVNSPG